MNLPEPSFSADEYGYRLAKTQSLMQERGFDQLLVTDPANMNYLTGFNLWTMQHPQALLIPASGNDILLFTRQLDASGAVLTTHLTKEQVLACPERYVQQVNANPMEWLAKAMRERGRATGTLAIELDAYFYTVRSHQTLVAGLPDVRALDAQYLVNWVRSIKSDAEIDKMRTAGRIAERVMTKALEMIEPGVRQCDVVSEIYAAQIRGLENAGGDYTAVPPLLPTGAAAAAPHFTWSDAPFGTGQATALELGGCYQRYHAPLSRTVFLGEPPSRYAEMADVVGEGMHAALSAVRPGVRCEEIEAAWGEALASRGPNWTSRRGSGRIGYSMGLNYPPTWSERTISLRTGDTTVLQPNMTFHMILAMSIDGLGYEESESFIVTEHGADCLSRVPRGLTVKR